MKTFFSTTLLLLSVTLTSAQNDSRARQSTATEPSDSAASVRSRIVGSKASNHAENKKSTEVTPSETRPEPTQPQQNSTTPRWGNTAVIIAPMEKQAGPASTNSAVSGSSYSKQEVLPARNPQPPVLTAKPNSVTSLNSVESRTTTNASTLSATSVYRVGVGDVLDVRLSNSPTSESTLFTVQKNGVLEHPLLNSPISVAGLTTDEIAGLLNRQIKVIQTRVSVTVRDYASHSIMVSGLIDNPGKKNLRREAMPLYAVLSEALPRPEAEIATIVRSGKGLTVPLNDSQAMTTLVMPGDEVRVSTRPVNRQKYIYVNGEVTLPGERDFRDGMTLTQALMAAGGTTHQSKMSVRVLRRNEAGFLLAAEYNLPAISSGKIQDPLLQPGDRIEVARVF